MDVGQLIECVRKHVFLYDISHKDYKNPSLKNVTWESIGREMKESGESCRLKWKTVRDGYIKYKRQLKSKNSAKVIDYIWSSKLKFLDNHKVNRRSFYRSGSSIPDLIPSASNSLEGPQSNVQDEITSMLSLSPPPLVPLGSSTTFPEAGSTTCQVIKEIRSTTDDHRANWWDIDATDHLFLSYSATFKTFSPRQQALLKIQLAKLFANAELEKLDKESRGIDEENCSPVIIKTECERQSSDSEMTIDFNNVIDAVEVKTVVS